MWVKQCHKARMVNIPPIKIVIWGMVYGMVLPTLIEGMDGYFI